MSSIPTYHEPWSGEKPIVPRTITVDGKTLTLRYTRIPSEAKATELLEMIKERTGGRIVRIKKHKMSGDSKIWYSIYAREKYAREK